MRLSRIMFERTQLGTILFFICCRFGPSIFVGVIIRPVHLFAMARGKKTTGSAATKPTAAAPSSKRGSAATKPTAAAPSSKPAPSSSSKPFQSWDARRKKMHQNMKHEVEQELKRQYSEKLRNIRSDFSGRYKKLGQRMENVEEKVIVLVTKLQKFMDKLEDELFFRKLSESRPSPTLSGATSSSDEAIDNGGEPSGDLDPDLQINHHADSAGDLAPDLQTQINHHVGSAGDFAPDLQTQINHHAGSAGDFAPDLQTQINHHADSAGDLAPNLQINHQAGSAGDLAPDLDLEDKPADLALDPPLGLRRLEAFYGEV
ncbi:unnamed protein product [Symbiodinium sp. CCMP2592]|nr:unnamed protein product [Symbiodinium sp. CCMP2592]